MNSNIINTAVSNINEERTLEAVRRAQGFLGHIERESANLDLLKTQLKEGQEALAKLGTNELTYEKITGKPKSPTPGESEATIIRAVEAVVKARQECVESRSTSIASDNANKLDAIKATEKRISELRSELEKVTANTVTAAAIVG
jgi:hypothetical protein